MMSSTTRRVCEAISLIKLSSGRRSSKPPTVVEIVFRVPINTFCERCLAKFGRVLLSHLP